MKTQQDNVLPPEETIASFQVRVTSVHEATWQGAAEANGAEHYFQSEPKLLH